MTERKDEIIGWSKVQKLITTGRGSEAEQLLKETEHSVRASGDREELQEVTLAKSRLHLRLGLAHLSLIEAERAVELSSGANSSRDGASFFQRGLAYLVQGQEDRALRDMTRYVEIAERNDDRDAQVRGHFYNALAYERHGEPCMAAADIEIGRDIAKDIGSPLPHARLTSFLAHLWIRRGELKEAIALENEALRLVRPVSQGLNDICGGMVMLVNAEVQAGMGDWRESARSFQQSRDAFLHDPPEPYYFEALAHSWYGEILLLYKRSDEACYHLEMARSLFEGLDNWSQTRRTIKTMNDGTCPVCPAWPL